MTTNGVSRKLIRLSCLYRQRDDRPVHVHFQRDSEAFIEILLPLQALGYEYQSCILNYPKPEARDREKEQSKGNPQPRVLPQRDEPVMEDPTEKLRDLIRPADKILLVTRPPINDERRKRKRVERSENWIERKVLEACEEYFLICNRQEVRVPDDVQREISNHTDLLGELKTEIVVRNDARATYKKPRGNDDKTPVFLLHLPEIQWDGKPGPSLLCLFGMSGPITLIWAHLLRVRFPHLLENSRFLMYEIEVPKDLPVTPLDLDFANEWTVSSVFDLPIPSRRETKRVSRETTVASAAAVPKRRKVRKAGTS